LELLVQGPYCNQGDHGVANPGKHGSNFVEGQSLLADTGELLFSF
jgi:hypothetical protein